jgi:Tfp pilus assembly protein PilF
MDDIISRAQKAYDEKRFGEALVLFNQESLERSSDLVVQDRIARCLWVLKRPIDAIEKCKNILKLDENYVTAYLIMAEAYYDLGDKSKALENVRRAYSIAPNHVEVLTTYGSFLSLDGNHEEALIMQEKALQIDPDNYIAYSNLAAIYAIKGNRKKALLYIRKKCGLHPTAKNYIYLFFAYMDFYRVTNILLVGLILLSFVFINIQNWLLFILNIIILFLLIISPRLLQKL